MPEIPEDKAKHASYAGQEYLPEGETRAPGSRGKLSLEQKQAEMLARTTTFDNILEKNQSVIGNHGKRRNAAEILRAFLEESRSKTKNKERFYYLVEALYATALNPKSKLQVAAAEALLSRAYGKPKAAEEDLDAIKKGGLTLIYVSRPAVDPSIPVVDGAAQHALPPPEFIEGEVVEEP